jgi:signal peptidase I
MRRLVIAAAAAGLLAGWRRRFIVVTVTGVSMLPTLAPGDRLLVRRTRLGQVRAGQIAVVDIEDDCDPGEGRAPAVRGAWRCRRLMIKRVAAIPGHLVPATCQGSAVPWPARVPSWPTPVPSWPARVPAGMFIVLGDNPGLSYDSRQAGPIAGELLVGVAVRRISPPRRRSAHRSPALSSTAS